MTPAWQQLEQLHNRFDVPLEAVLKSDLLRLGVAFTPAALTQSAHFKEKSYFIFSFDRVSQKELSETEKHAAPEEICITGGPYDLKRTIVSVRLNPASPYRIDFTEEGLVLMNNGEKLCDVMLQERPAYYKKNLAGGKPVSDITPTIQWGYLIYITAFRLCQYWGSEEECRFCDINENYRQQKKERSYTSVKGLREIIESLSVINSCDSEKTSQAYTVTGGAVTKTLKDLTEAEFYSQYAYFIEKKFPGRWIGKIVTQALPLKDVKLLKENGYRIYHPNFEVWDKKLFAALCPGKESSIGRDEWIKRVVNAAEVFGPEHVIPNFVAGVELAEPYGFATVKEALTSTTEGLEFFMSKGIIPRFTLWCVEPNTALHATNKETPPLEYFVRLLQVYRDTHRKYKLPIPPGYGEAGIGKAVFSVSAFMDVL